MGDYWLERATNAATEMGFSKNYLYEAVFERCLQYLANNQWPEIDPVERPVELSPLLRLLPNPE